MENNNRSDNNFFSGFLFGVLVGAAVVFLLATKKGKKILKAISEEGSENITNLLNKIDKSVDLPDESFVDDSSFAEAASFAGVATKAESADKGLSGAKEEIVNGIKPKARRFFRGASKRVN